MHYHGYVFKGRGADIKSFDPIRRPGAPGFESATVPPEATSAWLRRPARAMADTWDDVEAALSWLTERYAEVAESVLHDRPPVETYTELAVTQLSMGNDVVWAWWLHGGQFTSHTVVCCPNRDGNAPCPLGRTDERPPEATRV